MQTSDEFTKGRNIRALSETFLNFYRHAPSRVTLIFTLMLIQGVSSGIGLLFIVPFLEVLDITSHSQTNSGISTLAKKIYHVIGTPITLETILTTYALIITLIATIRFLLASEVARIQQSYICHIRDKLYRPLLKSEWEFIIDSTMSDFIHCLTVQIQKVGSAVTLFVSFLSQLTLALIMIILAFMISWKTTIAAALLLVTFLTLLQPLNARIYSTGETHEKKFKHLFKTISEQLLSIKTIKGYVAEDRYADQIKDTGLTLEKQNVRFAKINAITQWVYLVGSGLAFALFFYISKTVLLLTTTQLILFIIIIARMMPQTSGLQKTYQQLLHVLPAFQEIKKMTNDILSMKSASAHNFPPLPFEKHLKLSNIEYQYKNTPRAALKDINLTIYKNDIVALTGPSGAGKSTLADIISGLLAPRLGVFACDGLPITFENREAWRKNIAYITQDTYLFNDTVYENLTWSCPSIPSDEDIWHALELSAAKTFVERLPNKLHTKVGDRGICISGGERQRLGLAQAILSDRPILILDEATSALDKENDQLIQNTLSNLKGKKTIIVIAHRESTLTIADRCISLNNGQLIEKTNSSIVAQSER